MSFDLIYREGYNQSGPSTPMGALIRICRRAPVYEPRRPQGQRFRSRLRSLGPQRFRWLEAGRLSGRVIAEEHADRGREADREDHRFEAEEDRPPGEPGDGDRDPAADRDADEAAEQAER